MCTSVNTILLTFTHCISTPWYSVMHLWDLDMGLYQNITVTYIDPAYRFTEVVNEYSETSDPPTMEFVYTYIKDLDNHPHLHKSTCTCVHTILLLLLWHQKLLLSL